MIKIYGNTTKIIDYIVELPFSGGFKFGLRMRKEKTLGPKDNFFPPLHYHTIKPKEKHKPKPTPLKL